MATVNSYFEKDRVFNAQDDDWVEFVNGLKIKQFLLFYGVHNDTRRIDSRDNTWTIKRSNKSYKFYFDSFKNPYIKKMMKWAIYKYLSECSVHIAYQSYLYLSVPFRSII